MKRLFATAFVLLACAALTAQQPQTPGQLRPRPAEGREPEFPQPTIREYKPRSTLVVPQHQVPRSKFPSYRDYHAFWKLYGIGLPDTVLKKLYYQNAMRVIPGLPRGRFGN